MARVVFHEHPSQRGSCLPGAFASYCERIPVDHFADLDGVWASVRARPFEPDRGDTEAPRADGRCSPVQRSRVWPKTMNCWEAAAHFVAGAERFLPATYVVHVWDRDLPNGARHVWPSLVTPDGHHLLVDLQTVAPREYAGSPYTGAARPSRAANASPGEDALGMLASILLGLPPVLLNRIFKRDAPMETGPTPASYEIDPATGQRIMPRSGYAPHFNHYPSAGSVRGYEWNGKEYVGAAPPEGTPLYGQGEMEGWYYDWARQAWMEPVGSKPANAGDAWYEKLLGGVHVAGDTVLKAVRLDDVSRYFEDLERDHLPEWAERNKPPRREEVAEPVENPERRSPPEDPEPRRRRRGGSLFA